MGEGLKREERTRVTAARLFLKAAGRTERKLVFNHESGEVLLLKQRDINECIGDLVMDRMFEMEDHF